MKSKYYHLLFGLLFIFISKSVTAAGLTGSVQSLIQASNLRDTKYGIVIFDTYNRGKYLAKINENEPMIPASNMKLLTSACSIGVLGEDFKFKTNMHLLRPKDWEKKLNPGVHNEYSRGTTLIIKGDGDPSFGDPVLLKKKGYQINVNGSPTTYPTIEHYLNDWVDTVVKQKVKVIGYLLVDDRVFNNEMVHASWDKSDLNKWYAAQVSGLNFHNNCLDVYPMKTRRGASTLVKLSPHTPYIYDQSRNVSKTGSRNTFWVSRKDRTNQMVFRGEIKTNRKKPVSVTVHDPALFFANILAERLRKAGIEVEHVGKPKHTDLLPLEEETIIRKETQSLDVILNRCNKDSQNLYAESLLKRMGRKITGTPGSWENGAAAMREYLGNDLQLQTSSIKIVDGSGLSAQNRVSASDITKLLTKMLQQDKGPRDLFFRSLAVSGENRGTISKTRRSALAKELSGRVYAKTGTISGVKSLSGYLWLKPVKNNHVIAFSFIFNNIKYPISSSKIKKLQDDILKKIDEKYSK